MSIGPLQLLLILALVLIIFGGRKMPELGRSLGEALANFRKAVKDDPGQRDKTDTKNDETK